MANQDQSAPFNATGDVLFNGINEYLRKKGVSDQDRTRIAALFSAATMGLGTAIGLNKATSAKYATQLAEAILRLIGEGRKVLEPAINPLIGAVLSEMLGTEISHEDLPVASPTTDIAARAAAIGNKVYEQLTKEFVPQGTVDPKSGETAAHAFTGYAINFAVVNTFISVICELVSDEHLQQFRELGVEVAQNLGLGRLQRHVLGVLVRNTIEKPYDAQLRARYRPDRLTEGQYVRAYNTGDITLEELRQELAYAGYKDSYIDIIISQYTPRLSTAEAEQLELWSESRVKRGIQSVGEAGFDFPDATPITKGDAIEALREDGAGEVTARRKLVAQSLLRATGEVNRYLNHIERLAVDGHLDPAQASSLIQECPINNAEIEFRLRSIGLQLDAPRKELSVAEMEFAYAQGLIDITQWEAFIQRLGYSPEAQDVLTGIMLIKAQTTPKKKSKSAAHQERISQLIETP